MNTAINTAAPSAILAFLSFRIAATFAVAFAADVLAVPDAVTVVVPEAFVVVAPEVVPFVPVVVFVFCTNI